MVAHTFEKKVENESAYQKSFEKASFCICNAFGCNNTFCDIRVMKDNSIIIVLKGGMKIQENI